MKDDTGITFDSLISKIVNTLLYTIFLAVNLYRMGRNIRDIPGCFTSVSCNEDTSIALRNIIIGIFCITITLALARILLNVRRINTNVGEVRRYNELLSEISRGSINIVDEKVFSAFYTKVLEEIAKSGESTAIIATSSFTPPTQPLRDKYFSELAKLITTYSADYKVLMAKGDGPEWDELCLEELNIRREYLDRAAEGKQKPGWYYNHNFTAKRSRFHARMDFLVVEDSVFINMSLSKGIESNNRGYLYINDKRTADLYRRWFFTIWNDDDYSHKIHYEWNSLTGKYDFRV